MDDSFMNLGEEVVLTLLWQSGASESATVCFVIISLTICYLLFKCVVLRFVCVCVCVWERKRERESQLQRHVCVCVWVCVRVWERETRSHNRVLCTNTYELHYCVCHATQFPFRAWTDCKTKDIINCLYFSFESWSSWLWKGELHFRRSLWCSANHNALGQLANQSRLCLPEGGTL